MQHPKVYLRNGILSLWNKFWKYIYGPGFSAAVKLRCVTHLCSWKLTQLLSKRRSVRGFEANFCWWATYNLKGYSSSSVQRFRALWRTDIWKTSCLELHL